MYFFLELYKNLFSPDIYCDGLKNSPKESYMTFGETDLPVNVKFPLKFPIN